MLSLNRRYSIDDSIFMQFIAVEGAFSLLLYAGCRLDDLLPDLQARLAAGESVYLHCWGGRGRAGLVGACLLGRAYGLSAEEALERVGRAFSTRNDEGVLWLNRVSHCWPG